MFSEGKKGRNGRRKRKKGRIQGKGTKGFKEK
jgi:hypothetical protein